MISRWICEKCKRKWIYPLEKCAYCATQLRKQLGTKIRVIGITKVSIPSTPHPIVPYNIVLLEDEFLNKIPKKTMREFKIGENFSFDHAKTNEAVSIVRTKYDLYEELKQSISLLKQVEIVSKDKIFIKVSCIEASSQKGASTNPLVLEQLIVLLKERKVEEIVVGEQSLIGDSLDSMGKAGILEICKKHGATCVDLSKEGFTEKIIADMKLKISNIIIGKKLINLPVMNTHSKYKIVGGAENLLRLFDLDSQKMIHETGVDKTLQKISSEISCALNIGDRIISLQGNYPGEGEPVFSHLLFGSKSTLNMDRVFAKCAILDVPNYLKEKNIEEIEVVGEEIDCVKHQLKDAKEGSTHPYVDIIDKNSSPQIFMSAVSLCRKLIGIGEKNGEIHLVMGKDFTKEMIEGKERIVLFGTSAIEKGRSLGIIPAAEFPDEMPELSKAILLRSLLEDSKKKKIGIADMFKIKMAEFSKR